MDVIVIGGGPAGMLAGLSASKNGENVIILEKNNILGKKILVTGKGRCNITSSVSIDDFYKYIPGNGKFLYSSFHNFTNIDIIKLLETNGLKVKEERGNRIFPVTDKADDVRKCLEKELKKNDNIKIKTNSEVKRLLLDEKKEKMVGVELKSGEKIYGEKVILATGGKSYPGTGSTGDGYKMAKEVRTYYRKNKRFIGST